MPQGIPTTQLRLTAMTGSLVDLQPVALSATAQNGVVAQVQTSLSGVLFQYATAISNIHGKQDSWSQTPGTIQWNTANVDLKLQQQQLGSSLLLDSAGYLHMTSSKNASKAVMLEATHANGDLRIISAGSAANAIVFNTSNAAGGIDIDAGTGGVAIDSTGAISLDSSAAAGSNFSTSAGHLTVNAAGALQLTGSEAGAQAVQIQSSNAGGGIDIDAGTSGIAIDTTDGGAISIDAIGAPSNLTLTSTAAADDLTIAVLGATDSSLVLSSTGTGADALQVTTSAGGIDITNGGAVGEDIDITSTNASVRIVGGESAGDAIVLSATIGGIDILAPGAAPGEDIDITATGSSVNVTSTENQPNAIKLNASNAAGGIDIDSGTGGFDVLTTGVAVLSSSKASAGAARVVATNAAGSVEIQSYGTIAGSVKINAPVANASTTLHLNSGGTGVSAIDIDSSGGFDVDAAGAIALDAAAASNLTTTGATSVLTLKSTASDIKLNSSGSGASKFIYLADQYFQSAATTWGDKVNGIKFAADSGEISTFITNFSTTTSLIAAINSAASGAPTTVNREVWRVTAAVPSGTLITWPTNSAAVGTILNAFGDLGTGFGGGTSGLSSAEVAKQVDIFVNGQLLLSGDVFQNANGTADYQLGENQGVGKTLYDDWETTVTLGFGLEIDDLFAIVAR